jgi:S-adenosylmethionine:tRNA-ribosyltransferase-isomerase (queuine synthetase)
MCILLIRQAIERKGDVLKLVRLADSLVINADQILRARIKEGRNGTEVDLLLGDDTELVLKDDVARRCIDWIEIMAEDVAE